MCLWQIDPHQVFLVCSTFCVSVAYTSKYDSSVWFNQIIVNEDFNEDTPDSQGFFPLITNQNECRALNCLFVGHEEESINDNWDFTYVNCDTTSRGSRYEDYRDLFGSGCYCGVDMGVVVAPAKCCFYDNCEDIYDDVYEDLPYQCYRKQYISTLAKVMARSGGKVKRFRGKK